MKRFISANLLGNPLLSVLSWLAWTRVWQFLIEKKPKALKWGQGEPASTLVPSPSWVRPLIKGSDGRSPRNVRFELRDPDLV
jgi:hypothetical protein